MELFRTSNSEPILIFLILIGIIVLPAIYIIRKKKEKLEKILFTSIISFLIIYFPLVEYWSISISWSFWPSDFFHESNSVLSDINGFQFGHYPKTILLFKTLRIISELLLFFSIILFISFINSKLEKTKKAINWIPIFNIFSLSFYINKLLKSKWAYKILVIIWTFFTLSWVYYKFLAGPLFLIGFDSISFLEQILFSDLDNSEFIKSEYDIGYTYLVDILNSVIPVLIFIGGVLTLIVLKSIQNHHSKK